MFGINDLKRVLAKLGEPEHPRAERLTASGLAARYDPDSTSPDSIKNISATGIYLVTEKRLRTGELITLTLQEEGKPVDDSLPQFSVNARVARQGEDGIGLSFVLPRGMDTNLWAVLVRNIVVLENPVQIEQMFRILRTILFLCRLCQSEAEEAILLLGGAIDPERVETLVKIALAAESRLASEPDGDRMRAHPKLLTNILREGSWALDELLMQQWTGLLVSSCSADEPDESNQVCVNLLIHVGPDQAKIFTHACERALASVPGDEDSPSGSIVLTAEQMVRLTGRTDLYRNANDLAYLYNLGLFLKLFDFTSYHDAEAFDITPTSLGIELYKRCQGCRGKLDQKLIESAEAHLLNFIPLAPPIGLDMTTLTPYSSPDDESASGNAASRDSES